MRKSDSEAPAPEFVRMVRGALASLYDRAYLQNHPLVSLLDLDSSADHVTRAQGLRRILLESIEALRPERPSQDQPDAARAYAILTYRYVDGLSMEEIADKLALSRRQAYREHRKGIQAIASLLWDRTHETRQRLWALTRAETPTAEDADSRLSVAQTEVDHLQRTAHAEPLNPGQVLKSAFDLLEPLTQQTGAQVTLKSPDDWPSVTADRVMLRQALLNLLSYALHTVPGHLVITASQEGSNLLIHIDAFSESAPSSLSPSDRVGLTVAKALIEAQGGSVEMQQPAGEDGAAQPRAPNTWSARIRLPISRQTTLLVIDDNADIVALFRRYLAGHAITVAGATNGEEALRQVRELHPSIITLDVLMPSQDGWEILQTLKRSPVGQGIPIIICSVLNEPQLALAMGADDYIMKPVSQPALLALLSRWLGELQPTA